MDFVKREDSAVIDEENYKVYMENLQKSHQMDQMEYQHTPISMEQLHQVMQTSLNANLVHNFQLPISPRQMSTLMLKTNHITRNFTEIPAHLPRNLELELSHSLGAELPQNLCHEDIISQNLNRGIDVSLARTLGNEIDLQNSLTHTLVQNLSEDLRMNDVLQQNLRPDLHLSNEIDLSHHMNRQNLEQEMLHENRHTPMVLQCAPDTNIEDNTRIEQTQRLEQSLPRLEQSLNRIEQALPRLEQNRPSLEQNLQRLEQNGQRIDANIAQRLHQSVVQRLDQIGQRLDQNLVQTLNQERMAISNMINERQIAQSHSAHLPMQFHIKSEQEDDSYFYENINQGIQNVDVNAHIHSETQTQPVQTDNQIYSIYTHTSVPALNPIDLYARNQNYPQNYTRDNPQNLVVQRQYENSSPYPESKKRQDGTDDGGRNTKSELPKENLKPSDENKIFNDYKDENHKLSEELSMNIKGEYICYKCNEVFPSKRGLKQHAKSCAENEDGEKVGKFGCSQCAYRCQSPAILKIHERTHSGEKPFSCNFCDYKSGQKNNVAKHILVHMKEKPFRCQYCDYRCAQKNNLVVHERTHTGYKPFACPYCDYRTVQKPNLVKHMYLHTDQKPFSCDLCSYRCVQKTNLTKHKQRHLNDKELKIQVKDQKPYRPRQKSVKCAHCPYRCVQKSSMDKHMQFKHAGVEFNAEHFEAMRNDENTSGVSLMKNEDAQNLSVKKDGLYADVIQQEVVQIQS